MGGTKVREEQRGKWREKGKGEQNYLNDKKGREKKR